MAVLPESSGRAAGGFADWGYAAVDGEVRRVVGEAARTFEDDLGCTVEEAHPGFEDPFEAFWGLVLVETDLAGMRKMADELGKKMSPHLVGVLSLPYSITCGIWLPARATLPTPAPGGYAATNPALSTPSIACRRS